MEATRTAGSLTAMPFTKTLATATASALLAGGAVAYTGVAAATPSKRPPQTMGQKRAKLDARQAELAQRLGVSADQLQAAQGALLKDRLDRRVSKGTLTADERTAILACRVAPLTCDRTNLPARGARHGRKAKHRISVSKRMGRRATALAGELHLDRAKVLSALEGQRKAHHK
jgi:hypothetical protein